MLSFPSQRTEFVDRLVSARGLLVSGEATVGTATDISRETRGLAVVLMFAAYENLMKALCRAVLEEAAGSRAGNRRLKPGYKLFASANKLKGLRDAGATAVWTGRGLDLMELSSDSAKQTIQPGLFPSDGSFMKSSQITVMCQVLHLGAPSPAFGATWPKIDRVVRQRNQVAHGELRADQVGRLYTFKEAMDLLNEWESAFLSFITWMESKVSVPTFYLLPR